MKVRFSYFTVLFFIASTLFLNFAVAEEFDSTTDSDGDGLSDIVLYNPFKATFRVRNSSDLSVDVIAMDTTDIPVPNAGSIPVRGDFDGDGLADSGIFNRSNANWHIEMASGDPDRDLAPWGSAGDWPVPGRYRGNTCTDLATYTPSTYRWRISGTSDCLSSSVADLTYTLGATSGYPIPADYNGDGRTDLGFFDRTTGEWMIHIMGTTNSDQGIQLGLGSDIAMPADFFGQGTASRILFRPTTRNFFVGLDNLAPLTFPFGEEGDRPIVGDVDGDNKLDFSMFRPATGGFHITSSQLMQFAGTTTFDRPTTTAYPRNVPIPAYGGLGFWRSVPGDYDRDGRSEIAIANMGSTQTTYTGYRTDGTMFQTALVTGERVTSGDTDGDLRAEPIMQQNGTTGIVDWYRYYLGVATGVGTAFPFALYSDQLLTGDVDCDGKDDTIAVRNVGGLLYWYARLSITGADLEVQWGLEGDSIFVGDIDGNGCDDIIAARDYLGGLGWFVRDMKDGSYTDFISWGLADRDAPRAPMDFDGDGKDDVHVIRTVGTAQTGFARYSSNPEDYLAVPLGTDVVGFAGHWSGVGRAEYAAYKNEAVTIFHFDGRQSTVNMSLNSGTNYLVTPAGEMIELVNALGCDVELNFRDGNGGKLYKPNSDGVPGHSVLLRASSYFGRVASMDVYDSNNDRIGGLVRRRCCPNGGRAHFWISPSTANLARRDPITVKFNLTDGSTECVAITNAGSRVD